MARLWVRAKQKKKTPYAFPNAHDTSGARDGNGKTTDDRKLIHSTLTDLNSTMDRVGWILCKWHKLLGLFIPMKTDGVLQKLVLLLRQQQQSSMPLLHTLSNYALLFPQNETKNTLLFPMKL